MEMLPASHASQSVRVCATLAPDSTSLLGAVGSVICCFLLESVVVPDSISHSLLNQKSSIHMGATDWFSLHVLLRLQHAVRRSALLMTSSHACC